MGAQDCILYYLNNVNISTSITGVDEHWNFTQVIGSTQALTNRRNMNMNLFLSTKDYIIVIISLQIAPQRSCLGKASFEGLWLPSGRSFLGFFVQYTYFGVDSVIVLRMLVSIQMSLT